MRTVRRYSLPFQFRSTAVVLSTALVTATSTFSAPAGATVTIHDSEDVLAQWTFTSGGNLFMRSPEGDLWEFVTDIEDQAIHNKGEGKFFPLSEDVVKTALQAVSYPVSNLDVEIFILPFPRRGLLPSNAGHSAIYLSPGVALLTESQTHSVVAHELGHVLHHHYLPDSDQEGWAEYRDLRGIVDESVYHGDAMHAYRPHEIFAEDFRFLFGGAAANYSGSIENHDLALPNEIAGLPTFFRKLSGFAAVVQDVPMRRLHLFPNPASDRVNIEFVENASFGAGEPLTLRVFDLQGRILSTESIGAGPTLSWGGRLDDGVQAPPGVYFLEVRASRERWMGKVLIAR